MQMDPVETRFSVNERIDNISRQVKQDRLIQQVKTLEQEHVGRFSGWLSLASLRNLMGFGNGRAGQGRVSVKSSKPEEQCC